MTTIESSRIQQPKDFLTEKVSGKPTKAATTLPRGCVIAMEALNVASIFYAPVSYIGNIAQWSFSAYKNYGVNSRAFVISSLFAYTFYAKPIVASQVFSGVIGVGHVCKAINEFVKAGTANFRAAIRPAAKEAGMAVYHLAFVGVLATQSPQLIAISLLAQAVFSYNRASAYAEDKKEYEAGLTYVHAGLSALRLFTRRNDLLTSVDKYADAFGEFKNWTFAVPGNIVSSVTNFGFTGALNVVTDSASCLSSTVYNFSLSGVKDWAVDQANLVGAFLNKADRAAARLTSVKATGV